MLLAVFNEINFTAVFARKYRVGKLIKVNYNKLITKKNITKNIDKKM